ncbi:MAG: methylenetetrahydrofolate reductase [Burkholderiales bacterium]|jgi:hypothetical protein
MLIDRIRARESGIVLYGLVPPRRGTEPEKMAEIAELQARRLEGTGIDGLVLYDIQDEASRTSEARPFPYMETTDGLAYGRDHLSSLPVPRIVYRAVGKYGRSELSAFLAGLQPDRELTVFVGAASVSQAVTMSMGEAYALRRELGSEALLGGVTIPERHRAKGTEHLRVFEKIAQGCSFFVSQGVYDVEASKDLLSDCHYHGREHGLPLVPIVFTLTPCGSEKTLRFMKWLGISIPRWLENDLIHSDDILQRSVDCCERNWRELKAFADEKGIPIGCNIESVAVRKVEVEASIELLRRIGGGRPGTIPSSME